MAVDSTAIVTTANGIAQAFQILWPIITSVLAYIIGHTHTQNKAKKRVLAAASPLPQDPKPQQ
jgi:hypothetical protein